MGLFDSFKKKKTNQPDDSKKSGIKTVDQKEFDKIKKNMGSGDLIKSAALNFNLGERLRNEGSPASAKNSYLHAVENIREISEKSRDPKCLTILYLAYMRLADLFFDSKDYENAGKYNEQASKTASLLTEAEPDNQQRFMDVCKHLQMAGYCYLQLDDYMQAYNDYLDSLFYIRDLVNATKKVFVHPDREYRIFDSYQAEACIRMIQLQHDHGDLNPSYTIYELSSECVSVLHNLKTLVNDDDRNYDFVNGIFLCALCMEGHDRAANLQFAADECETYLENCQNRVRFLKLQKAIKKEMA